MPTTKKTTKKTWKDLAWDDLELEVQGVLVIKHGSKLEYCYDMSEGQTLRDALEHMHEYCMQHPGRSKKVTGLTQIIERTKFNGSLLKTRLTQWIARGWM